MYKFTVRMTCCAANMHTVPFQRTADLDNIYGDCLKQILPRLHGTLVQLNFRPPIRCSIGALLLLGWW